MPAGLLASLIADIPPFGDSNLLVGYDNSDDGAVFRLSDDIAIIQTLDFFAPMVADPYIFGQIAAANALSDVYAMGGDVCIALNICAFPEKADPGLLSAIMQGGAAKVREAGGILCGGHSISDKEIKYGLSVTGTVHPDKVIRNNTCRIGDCIILTKPLGVGIITAAYNAKAADLAAFDAAIHSMQTLNRAAFELARNYRISAQTDVTGFGFLGHLNEMAANSHSIAINPAAIPIIPAALDLAAQFLTTAAGTKNRQQLADKIHLPNTPAALLDVFCDPQTSGGLLIATHPDDAPKLLNKLQALNPNSAIIGNVINRQKWNILDINTI